MSTACYRWPLVLPRFGLSPRPKVTYRPRPAVIAFWPSDRFRGVGLFDMAPLGLQALTAPPAPRRLRLRPPRPKKVLLPLRHPSPTDAEPPDSLAVARRRHTVTPNGCLQAARPAPKISPLPSTRRRPDRPKRFARPRRRPSCAARGRVKGADPTPRLLHSEIGLAAEIGVKRRLAAPRPPRRRPAVAC